MKFYLLTCILFLLLNSASSQPAGNASYNKKQNSLLWEISGPGIQTSYLFGTLHMMCREDIVISANLKGIVKEVDEVLFELDMDDVKASFETMGLMKMKNDTVLSDLYSPKEYQKIKSFFNDSLKLPIDMLKGMKPLLLQALFYPRFMSCKSVSGMEQAIVQLAKQSKKEISGLETMAFQASIFDSIPYKMQAAELLKMIDSMQETRNMFEKLQAVYKSQDLGAIDALTSSAFTSLDSREILLDNRNIDWVGKLHSILPKKRLLVAVGAGHLRGKKGLIALLKMKGYTLRPLAN